MLRVPTTPFDPDTVAYKDKDKVLQAYARLDEITNIQDLIDLEDMFDEWNDLIAKAYANHHGVYFGQKFNRFFIELKNIDKRIQLLEKDEPNAKLLDQKGPLGEIRWSFFLQLVEEHCFKQNVDNASFEDWLDSNLCSDWYKMDLEGESYGGYYKFPEGSYEKENAYQLSGKKSIEKLLQLPYPRELIKWIINYGCRTRCECYRFVKNVCIWFDKMIRTVHILTLQKTLIYQWNCKRNLSFADENN